MVLKRLLAVFGADGPTVDTVLPHPHTRPGDLLEGSVELTGGGSRTDIAEVALVLVVRTGDEEGEASDGAECTRVPVAAGVSLDAGEHLSIPFSHPVPWQAPITEAGGSPLPSVAAGLRTEVVVDGAADKGDLDRVHVHPLPVQERVLEAMVRLGAVFAGVRVEGGPPPGPVEEPAFLQTLVFHPAEQHAHEVGEVEVLFTADPAGVAVGFAFDRRTEGFSGDGSPSWFRAEHTDADSADWTRVVDGWIGQALYRRRGFSGHPGHEGEQEGGGVLGAVGGAALGVAGGLAAGYVAAEVVDEIGDALEGDEDEPEEAEEAEE
ncbi:sporulation protein [Glycomyces fuscus]|nr:sporulation protein [Glycomyces fuscus]